MNLVANIRSSLLKAFKTFADNNPSFSWVLFDAHGDDRTLPEGNLVGPSGFAIAGNDPPFVQVTIGLMGASQNDSNLFALTALMDAAYAAFGPGTDIPVYDAQTGTERSWLRVTGFSLSPVARLGDLRAIQIMELELASAETSTR